MKQIYIKTQFEGFHRWKDAPNEVAFLRNQHRHIFYVTVFIPVEHNDREIEFILFKREVQDFINTNINKEDVGSCEMIGEKIATHLNTKYFRPVLVDVSEDNENGAVISVYGR